MKALSSALMLGIALVWSGGISWADSSAASDMKTGSGTTVSDPGVDGEPKPAECRDTLDSWIQYVRDPNAGIPDDVLATITTLLAGDLSCEDKIAKVEEILNAYWATEPWCQTDRERFKKLYTPKIASSIPSSSQSTIAALLAQGPLTCSETLAAAVTIVRLYNQDFTLYETTEAVPLGDPKATSSDSVRTEIATRAKQKSSKRKLKACQATIKRLKDKGKRP